MNELKSAHEIAIDNVESKEEIVEKNKTDLEDTDEVYGIKEPKKSCRRCHGRGIEGWQENGNPILCTCLRRNGAGSWISWGHFKYLTGYTKNFMMGIKDEIPNKDTEAVLEEASEELSRG